MSAPPNYHYQCLFPHSELQLSPASTGDPPILQVGLALALMRSLLFSLGLGVHETLCVPFKSGVSVSPSPVDFL